MTEDNLIDDQSLDIDFYEEVQQKNKKHTKQATRFAILNATLYILVMSQAFSSLGKHCIIAFLSNMILFPILSFVLGLVLALIPYRGLTWAQKYKRTSLLTLLTLSNFMTIGLLLLGLGSLYEYLVA